MGIGELTLLILGLATPTTSHAGVAFYAFPGVAFCAFPGDALGVNFTLALTLTLVLVDAWDSEELKLSPVLSTWRFSYG